MEPLRMACWWLSLSDLDYPNPETDAKIKRRAKEYAEANVSMVYLFGAHFRFDFIKRLDSLHGLIRAITDACHAYGMMVADHHSVNLIHRYHTEEEREFIMKNSGPHLPLCPSFEEAEDWSYAGHRLNDLRMIDVVTRKPLWHAQYQGEGFCHRNPEFVDMYIQYAKQLIADTGIDWLEADDSLYYMHYRGCACKYCRAELKRRTGADLPGANDTSFWGNYDNPAWRAWIDLRYEAAGDFMQKLREALPDRVRLMYCGSASAVGNRNAAGADVRQFLRGADYASIELSGNTPPYKHDPLTINAPISRAIVNGSHHLAAAREKGTRCYGISFGFTEATANICWAVNKTAGADCLFCTLKDRLGLPQEILRTLPEEGALVKKAFTFEKEHPQLFSGEICPQVGVYFSYETRNHSLFGNLTKGYFQDYSRAVELALAAGLGTNTLFRFPKDASVYKLVLLPSPWRMTAAERTELETYLAAGGKVLACGPCEKTLAENAWELPNAVNEPDPERFMQYVVPGRTHLSQPEWMNGECPVSREENAWSEVTEGLFYDPWRISDMGEGEELLALVKRFVKPLPVQLIRQQGYFTNVFSGKDGLTLHLLAKDYDTDIDHHLDEIRYHRSRVNLITKAEPIGIGREVLLRVEQLPEVYTPFNDEPAQVTDPGDGTVRVTLPEKCAYAVLHFPADA